MQVFRAHEHQLNHAELQEIQLALKKGAVAIFPTDSVYTMACAFSSNQGIDKLCKLVGKKSSQANLSLLCSSFEMISDYTLPYSTAVFRLMKRVLPGPYTFILNADVRKFRGYENRRKTVGIRMPDEAFLIEMIGMLNEPLFCSSLHSEDEMLQYFTDTEEIEERFADTVQLFVDDGPGGLEPSTVIDCTGAEPSMVRQGKGEI
ncbi:MAG: threonylcarbamoyl-AMP synthase [Bacteroidetes bacterium]|nr:threonylcarbamoyl-AMP synthase [Bacteroidota bacterium]